MDILSWFRPKKAKSGASPSATEAVGDRSSGQTQRSESEAKKEGNVTRGPEDPVASAPPKPSVGPTGVPSLGPHKAQPARNTPRAASPFDPDFLLQAVQRRDWGAVQQLINDNPSGMGCTDRFGYTPTHWAVNKKSKELLELLLANHANINAAGRHGDTPLLLAAAVYSSLEMLEFLLVHGANPNVFNDEGNAPLHYAVRKGADPERARVLLVHGADANARNKKGWTPLMITSQDGRSDLVELLLTRGADVTLTDKEGGTTALHLAALHGQLGVATLLLARGANPQARDRNLDDRTPLHWAASGGFPELAELLLSHSASVDAEDGTRWTPLICAAGAGRQDMVELLLAKGANPSARNAEGNTSADQAAKQGHEALANYLREAEARNGQQGPASALPPSQEPTTAKIASTEPVEALTPPQEDAPKECGSGHDWSDCKCSLCGAIAEETHPGHFWNGSCKCLRCAMVRNQGGLLKNEWHDFVGDECRRCGVKRRGMTVEYRRAAT